MDRRTYFVDVLLPLPLANFFTYRVPQELEEELEVGRRIVVPFGPHKKYSALILRVHETAPQVYITKYAQMVLDSSPIVCPLQMEFWQWLSRYYLCHMGEVMSAALPSALKLTSESSIVLNPDFDGDVSELNEREYWVAEALQHKPELTIAEISRITGLAKTMVLVKNLRDKKVVMVKDEIVERVKPKMETYYSLSEDYQDEISLRSLFDHLEKRAYKQLEILMRYIQLRQSTGEQELRRGELLLGRSEGGALLQTMVKKGIFTRTERVETRLQEGEQSLSVDDLQLSEDQSRALSEIHDHYKDKSVVLLHGVTSSGKTELAIKLIEETIQAGKQVLYLLPEIALTSQIIGRLQKYFGHKVGVYHSRFNEQERVEVWQRVMQSGESSYPIVLGARSAIFLPFDRLGLIIVDEEHESSFKQYDPAPRYNARDAAIYLSQLHGAKTLLASATPSIESYSNAQSGKYGLVEMLQRYGGTSLPKIVLADMRAEKNSQRLYAHFSSLLYDKIATALERKEQVILFQNRRGFALRLECDVCGDIPQCTQCDVSLTYHKQSHQLKCHYCGLSVPVPEKCPKCGHSPLTMKGFGTEKIEDDLSVYFPQARIRRMDLDTTRSKNSYRQIISDFEDRKIDILVGTQMVTKGLDFDNVSLVGILNADNLISFPDFRAHERSYQLMAQVSGRAGRRETVGEVIIQTYNTKHPLLQYVIQNNYTGMYTSQMLDRQQFRYPPYYRLIHLNLKHKDFRVLDQGIQQLAEDLRKIFGKSVLGPNFPLVSRIQNYYIKEILLKFERNISIHEQKQRLLECLAEFSQKASHKSIRVVINVDPM